MGHGGRDTCLFEAMSCVSVFNGGSGSFPGSELASDLLMKPVTSSSTWQKFYDFMGLVFNKDSKLGDGEEAEPKSSSQTQSSLKTTIATVGGIVGLAARKLTSSVGKVARLLAITAIVAHLALTHTPKKGGEKDPTTAGPKAIGRPTAYLREGAPKEQAVEKRCLRENEPRPKNGDVRGDEPTSEHGVRDHEPTSYHCSPEGSPVRPRIKACRAEAGPGMTPWEAPEFDRPPYAANEDLWINMPGGWVVRAHRSLRSRLFQPVHRTAPVRAEDLESRRVTVI